jgi:hypothetical protein
MCHSIFSCAFDFIVQTQPEIRVYSVHSQDQSVRNSRPHWVPIGDLNHYLFRFWRRNSSQFLLHPSDFAGEFSCRLMLTKGLISEPTSNTAYPQPRQSRIPHHEATSSSLGWYRRCWIVGPRVFWITPLQILLDHCIACGPETGQVVGNLLRPLVGSQKM